MHRIPTDHRGKVAHRSSDISADMARWWETYLDRYGPDTPRGVGDLRGDADTGHRVMLQVIREPGQPTTLLDFGCGLSIMNDVLVREGPANVIYSGLDLSERFLAESRRKYPDVTYYKLDALTDDISRLPDFDYVVMNGIFTYKGERTFSELFDYLKATVRVMFTKSRKGLAFNVHSKQVDWERDDLFHLAVDDLLSFLALEVSRHVVIRHDYGLYEYTVYVYRRPSDPERADAKLLLNNQSSSPAR